MLFDNNILLHIDEYYSRMKITTVNFIDPLAFDFIFIYDVMKTKQND